MNEEMISKICELIRLVEALLSMIGVSLVMCLSSVAGSAIYDLVTRRKEHKWIKEARFWKGRGKYPPMPCDRPFINVEDEADDE